MNSFMNNLTNATNFDYTQNGALAYKSTKSAVYDMFALGGAYRQRSEEDCILLFKNALIENESLALKCLFYLRDCRGGQGERRFFRVCYHWLAKTHPSIARRNLHLLSEYGRYDDLFCLIDTPLDVEALQFIKEQLALDVSCKTPSLLAKWLPSENASSKETKRLASIVRNYLNMSHRQYRETLSILRERINIVERLMSKNEWDKIEFDKIPSKAGLVYKNAFARRDVIAKKYESFVRDENKTVNAKTLYPYEVVRQAVNCFGGHYYDNSTEIERLAIEKYWNNLPDYLNGADCSMMCVVDTSGSMTWGEGGVLPIDVAISLGMYCAERLGGAFKDHYISFSSRPQLIKVEGVDFVDKVKRIYKTNLCENTDIKATFDLLKKVALGSKAEDIPKTIVIISDMQIDRMSRRGWNEDRTATEMERIRKEWAAVGLTLPNLVYWNVNASKNTILDAGRGVTFVSGCSPVIFEQILAGKTGYELMLEKLMSARYAEVV